MPDTLGWLFTSDILPDSSPLPPEGEFQSGVGPGSERILEALGAATGNTLHRVRVRTPNPRWRIDASRNARPVLRQFCKAIVVEVLSHYPDVDAVVRAYFEANGAYETARAICRYVEKDFAWSGAWDAARGQSSDTDGRWNDARDAAAVAGIAAYGSGWDPRRAAARDALKSAVRSSEWDAAWEAVNDVVWVKAWNGTDSPRGDHVAHLLAYDAQLEALVMDEFT